MGHPLSVRLDEEVQATLEEAASARGIGLSTYLRDLALIEARRIRRERIREQSRLVAEYVANSKDAKEFFEDWGGPENPPK